MKCCFLLNTQNSPTTSYIVNIEMQCFTVHPVYYNLDIRPFWLLSMTTLLSLSNWLPLLPREPAISISTQPHGRRATVGTVQKDATVKKIKCVAIRSSSVVQLLLFFCECEILHLIRVGLFRHMKAAILYQFMAKQCFARAVQHLTDYDECFVADVIFIA